MIVVALLGLSLWYALGNVDWKNLGNAIGSVHVGWVAATVAVGLLAHLFRAQRWRMLIPDGNRISLMNAYSATIIGYMMSNIIPRSGEIGRPYILARREKRSTSSLVATIVVERILDSLTLLLLLVLLLATMAEMLDRLIPGRSASQIAIAISVPMLALVVILFLALKTSLGDRLVDLLARWIPARVAEKLRGILAEFRAGIGIGGASGTAWILLWTVLIWISYGMGLYFGFRAFDMELGIEAMVPMMAITTLGVAIAPTPGGFGVYHSFCKLALVNLYAVPVDQAVAYALVTHAAPYLSVMILGALFMLRENVSLREANRGERTEEED